MDPELKKALDALSATFVDSFWRDSPIWHWAWAYRGEAPPPHKPLWSEPVQADIRKE